MQGFVFCCWFVLKHFKILEGTRFDPLPRMLGHPKGKEGGCNSHHTATHCSHCLMREYQIHRPPNPPKPLFNYVQHCANYCSHTCIVVQCTPSIGCTTLQCIVAPDSAVNENTSARLLYFISPIG